MTSPHPVIILNIQIQFAQCACIELALERVLACDVVKEGEREFEKSHRIQVNVRQLMALLSKVFKSQHLMYNAFDNQPRKKTELPPCISITRNNGGLTSAQMLSLSTSTEFNSPLK